MYAPDTLQDSIVIIASKTPFFRDDSGQILYLPVVVPAVRVLKQIQVFYLLLFDSITYINIVFGKISDRTAGKEYI